MTKSLVKKKLSRAELHKMATLLRGQRESIAKRAGVSKWTVNNTFQDRFQNADVLKAAKDMIKEMEQTPDPTVDELKAILASH